MKKLIITFMALMSCMMLATGANASTQKIMSTGYSFEVGDKLQKSVSLDITGDGKVDTVDMYAERTTDYDCTVRVAVNGKLAYATGKGGFGVHIYYLRGKTNKDEYIWIHSSIDNGDAVLDHIFKYDNASGKLVNLCILDSCHWLGGISHCYADKIETTAKGIKVQYSGQFLCTGYRKWSYEYVLKNGKLQYKNPTTTVNSKKYTATKNIKFYKKANSKKVSFVLKKGQKVTLKKVTAKNRKYFLQFKMGKKSGWIKAKQYEIFKDVILAG